MQKKAAHINSRLYTTVVRKNVQMSIYPVIRSWRTAACLLICLSGGSLLRAQEAPADEAPAPAPPAAVTTKSPEFLFGFLEYRYALHGRVVKRWEDLVRINRDKLAPGRVTLRYFINPEGWITVIDAKNPPSPMAAPRRPRRAPTDPVLVENHIKLATYALALENESPAPFPQPVRAIYPNGYFYQISLVIN